MWALAGSLFAGFCGLGLNAEASGFVSLSVFGLLNFGC